MTFKEPVSSFSPPIFITALLPSFTTAAKITVSPFIFVWPLFTTSSAVKLVLAVILETAPYSVFILPFITIPFKPPTLPSEEIFTTPD